MLFCSAYLKSEGLIFELIFEFRVSFLTGIRSREQDARMRKRREGNSGGNTNLKDARQKWSLRGGAHLHGLAESPLVPQLLYHSSSWSVSRSFVSLLCVLKWTMPYSSVTHQTTRNSARIVFSLPTELWLVRMVVCHQKLLRTWSHHSNFFSKNSKEKEKESEDTFLNSSLSF